MDKIEKDLSPIFDSLQHTMSKIYSGYTSEDLGVIFDVTNKYNKVMQERTVDIMKSVSKKKGIQ